MVYSRKIDGQLFTFGISGRLYKSNVLLYDHQTESLWSQLKSQAISGDMVNRKMLPIPSTRMRWEKWKQMHPRTSVLSNRTGYQRDYTIDPYKGYYQVGSIMFPVGKVRIDLPAKERIVGIEIKGTAKAYTLDYLQKQKGTVRDRVGSTHIVIEMSPDGELTAVRDASGNSIQHMFVYWFAWQAFYPQTELFSP